MSVENTRMNKIKQGLIAVVVLLVIYVVTQVMVGFKQATPRHTETHTFKPAVEVQVIDLKPLAITIYSQGTVQAKQHIDVVSEVAGAVTWVSPRYVVGGQVTKGEVLLKLEPISYEVAVAEATANVAQTYLNLLDEQAEYKRGTVYRSQNTASNSKADSSVLRKHKLTLVEAEYKASKARLQEAEHKLKQTIITAPFDALVSDKQVDLGQFVNMNSVLMSLEGVSAAEVRLPITAAQLAFLKAGSDNAVVSLSSYFGALKQTWPANIIRIEQFVNSETRVFNAVAEVVAPYEKEGMPLSLGLFVEATIEGGEIANAVRIPRQSLHGQHVFVVSDDRLEKRTVNIYRQEAEAVIIDKGLLQGDKLVTTRLELMVDGMAITTEPVK